MASLPAPDLITLVAQVRALHPEVDALVHLADAAAVADELAERADELVGHFVEEARTARRLRGRESASAA